MALRSFSSSVLSGLGLKLQAAAGSSEACGRAAAALCASRLFSSVAEGYKYAKSHEWAKVDGDVATVGISDHAQAELGDVVYVELPDVGKSVKSGETFGVVESVKAASDVYSPVSGEVLEVNSTLAGAPATINKDPYTSGWLMKVKLSNKAELSNLLDAAAYKKEIEH